jgi:hypothetical protein
MLYSYLHAGNSLKKEPAYSTFKEAVVMLNLKMSINFDELHKDFV